jgi:hypothetical protein
VQQSAPKCGNKRLFLAIFWLLGKTYPKPILISGLAFLSMASFSLSLGRLQLPFSDLLSAPNLSPDAFQSIPDNADDTRIRRTAV